MHKLFLFVGLCFFISMSSLSAQSQVENMLRDVKTFNKAYLDNDFEKFTQMTVPSIVKLAGGEEIMTRVSKEQYGTMVSGGMNFVSISPKKPSKIMLAGEELHAIIPQEVITKMGKDKFKRVAYYLASSNDDGKTWTFVDLDPYDSESIKQFVPSFTGDLVIPPVEFAEKIK